MDSSLHPAVVLFTVVLALGTGVMFGIVPALAVMRGDLAAFLKEDGAKCGTAGRRSTRAHAALAGREYVVPDDLHAVAVPVLAHRLVLSAESLNARRTAPDLVRALIARLPVPHGPGG